MKYVEEWIKEEIEYNNKMYKQAPIERAKIREEAEKRVIERLGEVNQVKMVLELQRDGLYKSQLKKWSYWLSYRQYGPKVAQEKMEKDVRNHFNTLQAKVEKKIGKILEIESLGGSDYRFIGEEGNCSVEVILAGGYNIQRLHTRWIIKK